MKTVTHFTSNSISIPPEKNQRAYDVFIVNFERISQLL